MVNRPIDLTGSQPVWLAEVRHITSAEQLAIVTHHRPDADGGPVFNQIRTAKRWCETTLTALIASGVHPTDTEAVVIRGRYSWPHGRLHQRRFTGDDPEFGYTCRSDRHRHQYVWIYSGHPENTPQEGETL